jgi:hypothetical protein
MRRLAAPLAFAFVMAVAACGFVPRPPMVCDRLPSDTCREIRAAVLADLGTGHPVGRVVVVGYRGCLPLPISCPLMRNPPPRAVSAIVGVRFTDGAPSVLRQVGDVAARPLLVSPFGDTMADALIDSYQGAPTE